MNALSLSGEWEFLLEPDGPARPIAVPGCWEALGIPKDQSGPFWYRHCFTVPLLMAGQRLWLCFGAASYDCAIFINGQEVGRHRGLWDAFRVEITHVARAGESVELLVRVEKPASLACGPASEALPGRFPLKETLSGFLPYVWGHIFGGIWQEVTLLATGRACFEELYVYGWYYGRIRVEGRLDAPGAFRLTLLDPSGEIVHEDGWEGEGAFVLYATVPDPQLWSPQTPRLYRALLQMAGGETREIRFGLRSLGVPSPHLTLNGLPLYLRLALSWGWYPNSLHSNPGPEQVRADFERLRQLGFNGVKLCLWFPPAYYFDIADEMGMLLWVELPMWLPKPTDFFREQLFEEYERLVRQARQHPSVIIYTLGCELNRHVGADILQPLFERVKSLVHDTLVRDNSGSGEAYGGLLNEHADFYDYHFYSEPHFLRPLIHSFAPRWRPRLPWLFGEFCDYDTFRDLRALYGETAGEKPWWSVAHPEQNPQGARWQFDIVEQEARLRACGLWERGEELTRLSAQQGLLHRKLTLELVRLYPEISGYVVTGERDTPISTAGMWDDLGQLKFDPATFRAFNADMVVLVAWDSRRLWQGGGDRIGHWDCFSYLAGSLVRPHFILSDFSYQGGWNRAWLSWSVSFDEETPFATSGDLHKGMFRHGSGFCQEIGIGEFIAPSVERARQATLRASVQVGSETIENQWSLYFFPTGAWESLSSLTLVDPGGRLDDLRQMVPHVRHAPEGGTVLIATSWTPEVERFVSEGGAAILLQGGKGPPGPLPTVELPFWREAVKIIEAHPAWMDFPHESGLGAQFYGMAPDHALDISAVAADVRPLLRRIDTRTMAVHDYATVLDWGEGRLIVSTLRLEGGQGEQPVGISRNTAAAYLLACWARYLHDRD